MVVTIGEQQTENQTATSPLSSEAEGTFSWTKQWYPVAAVEFLDANKPHAIQLLGKDLVLWRDSVGKWRCFADLCPHRGVPLSEGRIEADGTLLCAYHAWRFSSEGHCVSIPQSLDSETEARNRANPRSCAIAYPTQERQGLLWVWAEAGAQAWEESKLRLPRIVPELENPSDRVVKTFWLVRDLPYGWDFFLENVADPAHVPVSHHGMMGSRYEDAKYYDMIPVRKISTQEGFSFAIEPTVATIEEAVHDFQPPCHMRIYSQFKNGCKWILVLYVVPTRPGWCRHIGCQVLIKNERGQQPQGVAFFALPMPVWLGHILTSLFLHQDLVFLHYQEKLLAKQKDEQWLNKVYTPNPQDKMVITLRQWIEQRAGGAIPWDSGCAPSLPPPALDKSKLFDVWTTHTQHCQSCQGALKNINRGINLVFLAAIICLFLSLFVETRAIAVKVALGQITEADSLFSIVPTVEFWGFLVATILLALGGYGLRKLRRLFYVYEFEHSHND